MNKKTIFGKLSYADSFSLLNAISGITSISMIYLNMPWYAFIFILISVLADGMDGMVARKYGGTLGIIDEFADMISFVAAPSLFIISTYGKISIPFMYAYVVASILHLLNYHYSSKDIFTGLPTPGGALVLAIISLLSPPVWMMISVVIIISFLVASPLKYVRIEGAARIFSAILIIVVAISGRNTYILFIFLAFVILYIILGCLVYYLR